MSLFPDAPVEVEPAIAPVIVLHPVHIAIRQETREGIDYFWVERHRGTRSTHAVIYDLGELAQLRDALDRVLGPR